MSPFPPRFSRPGRSNRSAPLLVLSAAFLLGGCWGGQRFAERFDEVPERASPANVLTREDIQRYPTSYSVEQVLVEAYASMQPGRISIRNMGPPLFVVDGVPTENGRAVLSMRAGDIESIELVRDAAASIYGFRGSNGAILVSTRRR